MIERRNNDLLTFKIRFTNANKSKTVFNPFMPTILYEERQISAEIAKKTPAYAG